MKIVYSKGPRGIALIIVMVVVVFLGILAGGFAYSMKVETILARNANNEPDLEWIGRSGTELAKYVISQQSQLTPYDSLNQKWAGGPGNSNDILSSITLDNIELGSGVMSIKIIDQERKFNINVATPDLLTKACTLLGVNATDISTVTDSIQDWIDPDDHPRLSGAESEYYLSLDPPYYPKNGPLDDIAELLWIKGISPELYWGAAGAHHAASAVQSAPPSVTTFASLTNTYNGGFVDLFAAIAGPQINLNTAGMGALQLLPGVNDQIAGDIIRRRSGVDGVDGTEDDTPFLNAQGLAEIMPNAQMVAYISRYCTFRSTTFEVHVDARIGSYHRHYVGMLRRNTPQNIVLLYFHAE